MLCCDIHEDSTTRCEAELEKDWAFCPECGRPAGHVTLPPTIKVIVEAGSPHQVSISIPCKGHRRVAVVAKFDPLVEGASMNTPDGTTLHADPSSLLQVTLYVPSLEDNTTIGRLKVTAFDGRPTSHGPAPRSITVDVRAEVRPPGGLEVEQTVLYFRDGRVERPLGIRNTGLSPVEFTVADIPRGYRASPTLGTVSAMEGGQPGTELVKVERDLSVQTVGPESSLTIRGSDNTEPKVSLRWESGHRTRRTPRAIVGIDLGTSYTSVAFRDCRGNPDLEDEVRFLSPPGYPDTRFRTYIWLGKTGIFLFGPDAYDRFDARPTDGYLFREAKLLLRAPDQVRAHPLRYQSEAIELAKKDLGGEWGEALITNYLHWIRRDIVLRELQERYGTTETPVQYVFSIPVLDFGIGQEALYERQRAAMAKCVEQAGFPSDFEPLFPFEPTCAATALLHPPQPTQDWPRLGEKQWPLERETRLAVFDSGGGTTDLILGRLSVGDGGRLELSVERCLGVGGEHETFGGEHITETMKLWLLDRPKDHLTIDMGLHKGKVDAEYVVADVSSYSELKRLQAIDELKARLAAHDVDWLAVHEELSLHRDLLSRVCQTPLESLSRTVEEHLFHGLDPTEVRYYLDVGGNTRVPAVARWLEHTLGDHGGEASTRHLRIPEDQRQLAVARGAAWIPDAQVRDPMPVDVRLLVLGSDGSTVASRAWYKDLPMSGHSQEQQDRLEVPARDHIRIEARCGPSGDHGRIGLAEWRNPNSRKTSITLVSHLQAGALRVSVLDDAEPDKRTSLLDCPL